MFVVRVISLNSLEKQSFYSFLALYLSSSLLFVLLSGYWYYSAQKNSLESETYYKLEHIADKLSALIINAQMKNITLKLPSENGFQYLLIHKKDAKDYKNGYFEKDGYKVLISSAPQEHLDIKYVIIKTKEYFTQLKKLKNTVFSGSSIVFSGIVFISILLSKLFMRPIHKRVAQIESFIQDVSHELNTPITALSMSASRAIKKGVYDKNILTNISISTKQLESIYKSLAYLNFSENTQKVDDIDLSNILYQTIKYYSEISNAKHIKIVQDISFVPYKIVTSRAELLFSNLISNAIKYSLPETTIRITLKKAYFLIEDEGVGIQEDKLDEIFKLYSRSSNIAGGFGIGLSIVKQICDTYSIRVELHSELGVGSSFKLHLRNQN